MTLREIIYDVRESFRIMSDDSDITNEYIAFLIKNARATVLQQRYSDPRNVIPSVAYQSVTVPIGIYAKSTITIPSIIKTTGNAHAPLKIYGINVADTNLQVPLNVVNLERLPFVGHNTFTSDQIYCAVDENGYIIFNSHNNLYKLIDSVIARGVFEDPEAAYAITYPSGDFYLAKYPIAEVDLMDVRKLVDPKIANILNTTKDTLNDSTEERLDKNPQGNQ